MYHCILNIMDHQQGNKHPSPHSLTVSLALQTKSKVASNLTTPCTGFLQSVWSATTNSKKIIFEKAGILLKSVLLFPRIIMGFFYGKMTSALETFLWGLCWWDGDYGLKLGLTKMFPIIFSKFCFLGYPCVI